MREAAERFKAAGVRWITGGGSEILTEDFRARHSKFKYTVAQYFEAQRAIVAAGLKTTATMVIGFDETLDERLEHLERTRAFQDETGGLASFLCWTFKPYFTQIGGIEITTAEYLRHLALCRIFFDNIPRIRTSVLTQNQRALEGLQLWGGRLRPADRGRGDAEGWARRSAWTLNEFWTTRGSLASRRSTGMWLWAAPQSERNATG